MKLVVKVNSYIFNGKFKHLSRFSMIGVINTIIDFTVFTIFHSLFGVSYVFSQGLGYGLGVVNSFLLNKKWTFADRRANKRSFYEFLQFVVVNLISLIITMIAMSLLVQNLNLNVYIAKVLVTVIAQVTNFLGYKLWVFN
ncbi:GtrA family protein [Clostridium magnum]|uniref:GtrA-like protein n=1 Tax=Clostridium magnum DSM 2767 TaxID=1121326 RepID=A0A161YH94_9CLOT|nr:GtrA family protein [Clostridium magnum]KZL89582.1 GtrA-like protein [Clostridium magnum DSM 2767]SHH73168.1 Putative flippase GtrA (transmembrane translocase of bactoprenol-linked glucose) [Clostridium magnum DSM 2767]